MLILMHISRFIKPIISFLLLFLLLNIHLACQPPLGENTLKILEARKHLMSNNSLKQWFEQKSYLAFAASGLSPVPEDSYGRAGWWGLNFSVAAKYGLNINSIVDERYDFYLSTDVARIYYSNLEEKFDGEDIDLIFLTSPLLVKKYLLKGVFRDTSHQIEESRWLLTQVVNLEKSKKEFYSISNQYPESTDVTFDTIQPSQKVYFTSLSKYLEIPENELERINPVYISGTYKPGISQVPLLITRGAKVEFLTHRDSIYSHTQAYDKELIKKGQEKIKQWKDNISESDGTDMIFHAIRSGDNLSQIARKYRVSVSKIKRWNNLRNDRIYAGKRLKIYVKKGYANIKFTAATKPSKSSEKKKKLTFGEGYESYTIKSGDTLWSISRKYAGITPDDIMKWNQIGTNIQPGQIIYIKSKLAE